MNDVPGTARQRAKARALKRAQRNALVAAPRPALSRRLADYDAFPEELVAETHARALRIVEELGIEFRDEDSLALWRKAGAKVDGALVRVPGELLMSLAGLAPSAFTLAARSPERSVTIGGRHTVFGPGYGAPNVIDLDWRRRPATLGDLENFYRLTHMASAVQINGGVIVEPTDVPIPHRHLHMVAQGFRLTDKPVLGPVTSAERAEDAIAMARLVFGADFVDRNAVYIALVNGNSPRARDYTCSDGKPVDLHRLVLATDFHLANWIDRVTIVEQRHRSARDEHQSVVLFVKLLEPGGEIHGVSVNRIVDSISGANVTGDNLTRVDSNPRAQRHTRECAAFDDLLHLTCGLDRLVSMTWIFYRHIKSHKHGITLKLIDDAAVPFDRFDDSRKVLVKHLHDLFRWHTLGNASERFEVRIKNSGCYLRRLETTLARNDRLGNAFGDVLTKDITDHGQLLYYLIAEPFLLQRGINAGLKKGCIERLWQVILGTELDAPYHAV